MAVVQIQQPPKAPRLGPRPAPMSLDELPFLDLPGPAMDFELNKDLIFEPLEEDSIVQEAPRLRRFQPSPSPMLDEAMPEFFLPEAALDLDGNEFELELDTFLRERKASLDSTPWSDRVDSDDESLVFQYSIGMLSECSTAIGEDPNNCSTPDSLSSSLSSVQGKQFPNGYVTSLKAMQAYTKEHWEATVALTC